MNLTKCTVVIALTVASALPGTVAIGFAQDHHNKQSSATLRGVWRTVVTPQNCQTGQLFPSLQGLFTFNQGGTMSRVLGLVPVRVRPLVVPATASGNANTAGTGPLFAFTHLTATTRAPFCSDSQKVTAALELDATGDEFVSRSAIEILDANGKVVGMGCATAIGTRFP